MNKTVEIITMYHFSPLESIIIIFAIALLGLILTFPFYYPELKK